MDSSSPLDPLDPNVRSSQLIAKVQATDKPLSRTPPPFERTRSEAPMPSSAVTASASPAHVNRPSLSGQPSFQRPRKRILWHNKACFIALPLENENGRRTTRESYLRPEDVATRIEGWRRQGFDTKGFVLTPFLNDVDSLSEGQSRPVHPDPEVEKQERAARAYRVNIPDRQEWENYVNNLKEQKLRSLGVSPGDDGHSTKRSPAPSLMSRHTSSQSSAMLISPPLAPSTNHPNSYPPPLQAPHNSHVGKPAVAHFPRYSMAVPFDENPFAPKPFPQARSPAPGTWSPQNDFASQPESRVTSPMVNGHVSNLDATLSPAIPPPRNSFGQISTQNPSEMFSQLNTQQSLLHLQHAYRQTHQQQVLQPFPLPPSVSPSDRETTLPSIPSPSRPAIVTPIPRVHGQNPSETLQRGFEEAQSDIKKNKSSDENLHNAVAANERFTDTPGPLSAYPQRVVSRPGKIDSPDSDTNPRFTGTPHFVDSQPRPSHSSKASISKLNVNAPEFKFEPKATAQVFAFSGDQQPLQPSEINSKAELSSLDFNQQNLDQAPHGSKLNVDAPTFKPGVTRKSTVPLREFSFSSSGPTFRPDAPPFKPIDPSQLADADESSKEDPVGNVAKIFGDVKFSKAMKPGKKSKAIPIVRPDTDKNSDDPGKSDQEIDGQEDESGRITQADGRQKRMRRGLNDGDQIPLFASPNHTPWLDRGTDERSAYFSKTPSPVSNRGNTDTLDAATDLLEEIIDNLSATEASDLMKDDAPVDGEEGRSWQPHAFQDIQEAASFNAALSLVPAQDNIIKTDPTSDEIARATKDFLGKSPQYRSELERALENGVSVSVSSSSSSADAADIRNEKIDCIDRASQAAPHQPAFGNSGTYLDPSDGELDAVMKHLNVEGTELGVERQPSPLKHRSPSISPIRSNIPIFHETINNRHMLPPAPIRSDAPSPSPNRMHGPYQYLPPTDSESADTAAVEMVAHNARYSPSYRPSKSSPPIHRLNSPGSTPPSDWDDAISSLDEAKFQSRTGFFDNRVNDLVGGIVQQRLSPLEKTLLDIQQSLAALSSRSVSRRPRSAGKLEIEHSDADDEDDTESLSHSRVKSPLRDRKYEQLRSLLNEIATVQQTSAAATQLREVADAVKDLKKSIDEAPPASALAPALSGDLRNVVEEAVGRQMRGRSAPVTSSSQAAAAEKSQLQIAGLESMLKIADARAEDELKARRATEDALADNQRLLRIALEESSQQRESAEATESSLQEYHEERQLTLQRAAMLEGSQESLEKLNSDLSEKNAALEDTLAEYRLSSDQWRIEIDDARHENKDLRRAISSLKAENEEVVEARQTLRLKFDRLQEEMNRALQEITSDHLRWRSKEGEHNARLEVLGARLEAEARTRERLDVEIERLEAQEKEAMKSRFFVEHTQKTNVELESTVAELKSELQEHQKAASRFDHELSAAQETAVRQDRRARATLETDLEAAKGQVKNVRADLNSVITRLEKQIEGIVEDAENARTRHEMMLEEASDSRSKALQEAADAREAALQEHYRFHERTLNEVKAQHERALNNALEDKQRSETYFGNRLSLADEKVIHYQDRVVHLEEKLDIAKSAAHAAVQATQSRKAESSPISSRTSQLLTKTSLIPDKISPQALRESILVLQEQLQEREARIEQLESELSSVDTTAPAKLKDTSIEITWLRELLGVRIDDLEDIINTLSQSTFDREAVKDAAIRLKANLQMEQQEKERAFAGGQAFPSLASISNLAASPKALPLAAAAAWGNWRKGRDSGFGNLSAIANGSVNQTPSKASPQSFFAGLMTPPSTQMRMTPPVVESRPTSSSSSSSSSKSLARVPISPRQSVSLRGDSRPSMRDQDPVTPPLMRKASYDQDACETNVFGGEGVGGDRMTAGEEADEPFGPRLGGIVGDF